MFFGISHGTLGMFQKTSAASLRIYRVILLMLSASNFQRSSYRQSNICLQFALCFDSVGFTGFSFLTS